MTEDVGKSNSYDGDKGQSSRKKGGWGNGNNEYRSLWIFAEKRKQEMGLWIYKAILFLDARQHNMLCF